MLKRYQDQQYDHESILHRLVHVLVINAKL